MDKDFDKIPIAQPTFLQHVRFFFDAIDIEHMATKAHMDLASYDGVKSKATQIYFQTSAGRMPPEPERRWTAARVETFKNWIVNGFPMGEIPAGVGNMKPLAAEDQSKVRMNAANLSQQEIDRLRLAFETIMNRKQDDPTSYFVVAGIHWLPEPFFCVHREPRYNPWHRVYVDKFEQTLRTVPGCEDITLPYWDLFSIVPHWLYEPPFASYTLPVEVGPGFPKDYKTQRNDPDTIAAMLTEFDTSKKVKDALDSADWESFSNHIEAAHNDGHVACGLSMLNTDVASFDPLFWFFHCNWERMWWLWQNKVGATTLTKFRSTLQNPAPALWLDTPPFNVLEPFNTTADKTIDVSAYAYETQGPSLLENVSHVTSGNIAIDRAFRLRSSPRLSIRVKALERLRIPGTFVVHLFADDESIAKQAVFQSLKPETCPNCISKSAINIDFIIDRSRIVGKKLEAKVESLAPNRIGRWIPLSGLGTPTINVRELLISD